VYQAHVSMRRGSQRSIVRNVYIKRSELRISPYQPLLIK
jgi:hypothetical protein